jgi:hypothetical protein
MTKSEKKVEGNKEEKEIRKKEDINERNKTEPTEK